MKPNDSNKKPILKEQAANVLSRGEKKLLITALRVSQLPLLLSDKQNQEVANDSSNDNFDSTLAVTPVVLLDDITAELDARALDILLATLATLPCQVFITSLTTDIIPLIEKYWTQSSLFHVKQGQLMTYDFNS